MFFLVRGIINQIFNNAAANVNCNNWRCTKSGVSTVVQTSTHYPAFMGSNLAKAGTRERDHA